MRILISFIALLCLINFNHAVSVSDKSTKSYDDDKDKKDSSNPLLDNYVACSDTEKYEEQLYVNGMQKEIRALFSADESCECIVQYCAKQEKIGTNWKANVKACDIEKNIIFYVDVPENDRTMSPKELRIANDERYSMRAEPVGARREDSFDDNDDSDDDDDDDNEYDNAETVDDEVITSDDTDDDTDDGMDDDTDDDSVDGIELDNGVIACPLIIDTVCCNGVQYDNKCTAKVDGVNVLTDCVRGECDAGDGVEAADTVNDELITDDEDVEELAEILTEAMEKYPELAEKIKGVKTGKNEENKGKKSDNVVMCTQNYDPLCCGSIDYNNDCLAMADNVKDISTECVRGKCSDDNTGYGDGDDDDRDYDDVDYAETVSEEEDKLQTLVEKIRGVKTGKKEENKGKKSENMVACTKELNYLCCSGVQYDNPCVAEADGIKDTDTECDPKECDDDKDDYDDKEDKDNGYDMAADAELLELEERLEADEQKLADRIKLRRNGDDDRELDRSEYSEGESNEDDEDDEVTFPPLKMAAKVSSGDWPGGASKMDLCDCPIELDKRCCGKGDKVWTDYASLCDAKCDGRDEVNCLIGTCLEHDKSSAAMVGHHSYLSGGLEATSAHSSQWNIMIVIIQLCILAVCCMSLGLSISFCFKNPNQLMGAGKKSFGPQDMV